jgi:cytochrome c oxidase assembly protein subunit 11
VTTTPPIDRTLPWKLVALTAAMFGFGFALVPLYDAFCALTGFGGKTAPVAQAAVAAPDTTRIVRVEFLASVPRGAPWELEPRVAHADLHPGELYVAHYRARNRTGSDLIGQAVPSVAPGTAAAYLRKTECFCFTQQPFGPHEERDLTVAFSVSPDLPAHLDRMSLAYTFYTVSQSTKD